MIGIKNMLLVGLGGSIGAICRYVLTVLIKHPNFPINTLIINIIGCVFIGLFFGISVKTSLFSESIKLFLMSGFCGGFTTFSAFSVENMQLLKQDNYLMAFVYIMSSIFFCLLAVFAGFKIINY